MNAPRLGLKCASRQYPIYRSMRRRIYYAWSRTRSIFNVQQSAVVFLCFFYYSRIWWVFFHRLTLVRYSVCSDFATQSQLKEEKSWPPLVPIHQVSCGLKQAIRLNERLMVSTELTFVSLNSIDDSS